MQRSEKRRLHIGRLRRLIPQVVIILWIAIASAGFLFLIDYGLKAGSTSTPLRRWPEDASFRRSESAATLVMIAHPYCPCTKASLRELELILTRYRRPLTTYVLLVRPAGAIDDWTNTALWKDAGALPGVATLLDDGGIEAARFGATTSGQVLLYDADGRLMFSGGITPSRGESGDNQGRESILSLLRSQPDATNESPVYGCPLFNRPRPARM